MSQVAECFILPADDVVGLFAAAAEPWNRSAPGGNPIRAFLAAHATGGGVFDWAGHILPATMIYLDHHGADLLSAREDISGELFQASNREVTYIVLSPELRALVPKLDPQTYSDEDLGAFFDDFYATRFPEGARAMRDAMAFLANALRRLDDASLALLVVG